MTLPVMKTMMTIRVVLFVCWIGTTLAGPKLLRLKAPCGTPRFISRPGKWSKIYPRWPNTREVSSSLISFSKCSISPQTWVWKSATLIPTPCLVILRVELVHPLNKLIDGSFKPFQCAIHSPNLFFKINESFH